ncbi:MAG: DUF6785 family protein, partial [Candidatus Zipacnadales bacterium]
MASVEAASQPAGLRARSFVLGTLLVPLVSLWVAGMENVYGGRPTYLSIFFHAVILLAALWGANALLQLISPRLAFRRAELLLIYIMIGVSSGIVGDQFMAILTPSLAYPFRYANEVNRWEQLLIPYLPRHAMVSDPLAVKAFYEGDASIYSLQNLKPWLTPGLLWASFIAVTQLMCLAINVIMRRQWTQYEKLSFPLIALPMEMTAPGRESIWRSRGMWWGFALSAAIDIVNGLGTYWPAVPKIPVKVRWLTFSPKWNAALTTTGIAFYPFVIGIAFLLPGDLTFSTWFFLLLFRVQRYLFCALGYPTPYPWQSTGHSQWPAMLEQGIGSYMAVVVFALWAARRHLASVWEALWHGPVSHGHLIVDSREAREYRLALATIGIGVVVTSLFASSLGMPLYIGVTYMLLYLVINTAIAKIRAEAGAPTHGFHFAGPDHVLLTLTGPQHMDTRQMAAWGLFWGFNRAYTGVPMPHQLEGMKIGELVGVRQESLTGACALATIVGSFSAIWALLHICYREGVEQAGHPVHDLAPQGWHLVNSWLNNPQGPNWVGLGGIVIGFAWASFLMGMRFRFVWWPFHPIGYAIAADWTTGLIWLPLLIGWALKGLILHYASPKVYRNSRPFFLGLILGEFAVGGIWSV